MNTRAMGDAPTNKKAKFTVSEAARAFRKARGNAEKIERIEGEKHYVRRDETGRFVIVQEDESSVSGERAAHTRVPTTRGRLER